MNQGYIKLHRKTLDSRVFQSEGLLKVWIWCLLRANHKGQWVWIKTGKGTTEVWIEPGQFIFGKYTAAEELKMPPSTVWKRIKKLIAFGNLVVKSNHQYSVITIVNWDTYQGAKEKRNHQGTTEEPPSRPNKNDKNEKNNTYSQNFISFWKAYPNKVAKKKAHEAWQKLEKAENIEILLPKLLDAIERQKQDKEIKKANGEFVSEWPNPATWLNGRRWEDEIKIKKRWDHATG